MIARSPFYFLAVKLISYYHFYITNFTKVLWMCQFLLIAISMVVSVNSNINIFDKNFNSFIQIQILYFNSKLVFGIAAGCLMRLGNIKKLTCWHPKLVVIVII